MPSSVCEARGVIRRVEPDDWERLRDVRLRALASDPDAFLETVENARTFPDVRWRERARSTERTVTFVHERDGAFDGMVSAFVGDDAATAYLVEAQLAQKGSADTDDDDGGVEFPVVQGGGG